MFRPTLFYKSGNLMCNTCWKERKASGGPTRSRSGCRKVQVDPLKGILDPGYKCSRCSVTAAMFGKKHCKPCRDFLKSSPGDLCNLCLIRPRGEKHKTCDECRADILHTKGTPDAGHPLLNLARRQSQSAESPGLLTPLIARRLRPSPYLLAISEPTVWYLDCQ
jgi:hypothetical protein